MDRPTYAWLTDCHLKLAFPGSLQLLILQLKHQNVTGVFLTGDISNGKHIVNVLEKLATGLDRDVYFVLGNHDYHGRSFNDVHNDMQRLTANNDKLHWMTQTGTVHLASDTALVGTEGWYDAAIGEERWLKYTFDWALTHDFRAMNNMSERIVEFKRLARESAIFIKKQLESALVMHDMVYLLTHVPPWRVSSKGINHGFVERFHLPYNTNVAMGLAIEEVMLKHPGKRVVVLSGHTHVEDIIQVMDNIELRVGRAKYFETSELIAI